MIVPKYSKKKTVQYISRTSQPNYNGVVQQKGIEMVQGHLNSNHAHLCLSIPPKYSVAFAIVFMKGKSVVRINRDLLRIKHVIRLDFWSQGYCVSKIVFDEEVIEKYICEQEKKEKE